MKQDAEDSAVSLTPARDYCFPETAPEVPHFSARFSPFYLRPGGVQKLTSGKFAGKNERILLLQITMMTVIIVLPAVSLWVRKQYYYYSCLSSFVALGSRPESRKFVYFRCWACICIPDKTHESKKQEIETGLVCDVRFMQRVVWSRKKVGHIWHL